MKILKQIETEINSYLTEEVRVSEGYNYSQHDLIKRIIIYANGIYPEGKIDSQGNYKYWFDICQSRIDDEVKNIDFDTKHIEIFVDPPNAKYDTPLFIINAKLRDYLREKGQAEEINEAIEEGAGWGNVVWKKIKGGYEKMDLKNTYIINVIAKNLNETAVIERHEITQSQLRAKKDIWKNVDIVIKECGDKEFISQKDSGATYTQKTETPYYEIFERNGEVSEDTLREAQGKKGGNENKYILAKITVAGLVKGKLDATKILYADEISEMPYEEYHRGRYNGRWLRMGIYEILFDIQTRCNEIGNQIARGLEWTSKTIFRSDDRLIVENIMTDIVSGDIIKSRDLAQVEVRMQGFDQLTNEWNRLLALSKDICKSYEIVQGETMPAGTPFRLGALLNLNANKFFDYIREKIGIVYEKIFENWILPDLIKDLKTKDIIEIAGDTEFMGRYYETIAKAWYVKNLLAIGPHNPETRDLLIQQKIEELQKRPKSLIKNEREMFIGLKARAKIVITGENVRMAEDLETLRSFAQLEGDPVRRTALIEQAMRIKGIDVSALPKSPPQPMTIPSTVKPPTASLELMPRTAGVA